MRLGEFSQPKRRHVDHMAVAFPWMRWRMPHAGTFPGRVETHHANQPAACRQQSLHKAASLDPHSVDILDNLVGTQLFPGETNAARATCARALKIDPEFEDLYRFKGLAYRIDGKPKAARPLYLRADRLAHSPNIPEINRVFDALENHGNRQAINDQLASMHQRDPAATRGTGMFGTLYIPTLRMRLGAPQQALDFIDDESQRPGTGNSLPNSPLLLPIFGKTSCTARFRGMVKSLDMTDPHAATVCAADRAHASSSPQ